MIKYSCLMTKRFHHFKGNDLTPSEKVERKVVMMLLTSKLPDSKRESSVVFELKHSSEVIQVARILAQKRGLKVDLAEAAAALHDVYVIVHGKYQDHGKKGALIAEEILRKTDGFSPTDRKIITEAVCHHSEKDIHTGSPYVELIKDADVFSCSMYKEAEKEYRRIKSATMFGEYSRRVIKVRHELGLPDKPIFRT
ncbi:hypothetical protein A2Y99_04840 [Candidatus Gottesmanbacteria bacterium RBG_13_37_7]|uniref:HD domain-containing protein n=1 Tax=Candidatus Gottesmanbacteria bacterium RBG_13_37_7 TaxID=1798369 RepID=A0A1F5YJ96_9BACT|nr:MAG: hypothetical protein A2Y99_04840 [Candidatus Gottesmanbacteria bacterium RBG_13_37_7]